MKSNKWDSIDIQNIIANDKTEVDRFYSITKPYMMYYFNNNEELFHDWFLKVITKTHKYKPTGKYSNWCFKIAENLKKENIKKLKMKSKIKTISYDKPINKENTYTLLDVSSKQIDYELWDIDQKETFEDKMNSLSQDEQTYIDDYIHKLIPRNTNNRQKYCRIIAKIKD